VIDVSGAGVLASSSHKSDAQKFVAFLVSRAGQ
jgi:ABC-type Fe3+ transport system substrate-binding protein